MALALIGKTCVTFSFGALFVYAAELVPTEIRTSAIGSASFLGKKIRKQYIFWLRFGLANAIYDY